MGHHTLTIRFRDIIDRLYNILNETYINELICNCCNFSAASLVQCRLVSSLLEFDNQNILMKVSNNQIADIPIKFRDYAFIHGSQF